MADRHIRRSADDYAEVFAGDLPTGPAWPRDADSVLMQIVSGLMETWGRVDGRFDDLLTVESDPRFTYEMLADWERAFGLPDECLMRVLTLDERRQALVSKLTAEGGQSRAFFIAVAAALGYAITIAEYAPFQFGVSSFGGRRGRFQPPSVRFYWTVHVAGVRSARFKFGGSSFGRDSFLEITYAQDLECVIRRWAPAHTIVLFDYSSLSPQAGSLDFGLAGNPFIAL